jgi:hypothetical protein
MHCSWCNAMGLLLQFAREQRRAIKKLIYMSSGCNKETLSSDCETVE